MQLTKSAPLLLLIAFLLWACVSQITTALFWGHDSFPLTEWLINYSGGFVRRGLPGTLIGWLADVTGIQANHWVIGLSSLFYLILAFWFLLRSSAAFPAILILSCVAMGFPAYQDSIIRKDCLGLLLLIACLALRKSSLRRPSAIFAINLLASLAIFSHETFVFYALAGFALFRQGAETAVMPADRFRRGLTLLPAVACFLLTVVFHGTPHHAAAINDSWLPLWRMIDPGPHIDVPSAAIQAIGWSSSEGLSLGLHLLTSGIYQPTAWAMVFAISFGMIVLFTRAEHRVKVTALLLAQLLFISPLFVLGIDYGRWLFLWAASSMIFHTANLSAPAWLESAIARLFEKARLHQAFERLPAKDWYPLMFGVPICWNLQNFIVASPLIRHLKALWSWL